MKILFCNKYNYPFSGTEVYLFELMELLRSKGHEVALFSMADPRGEATPYDRHSVPHIDFKEESGWFDQARKAAHAIYSPEARRKIRGMIAEFRPDVAHIRGIYHHLSPSILWELGAQNIPVVYHLNDFKLLCPNYNLLSRGKVCEQCKGGAFWHLIREKCYPGLGARTTLAAEAYVHRYLGTYRKCVNLFLAPSQFVRDKFVEHGWDVGKFEVLPHFQKIGLQTKLPRQGPIFYFGRLSAEKGVDDLLRAMQQVPHLRLIVAGEGPERSALQTLAAELKLRNVQFVGQVGAAERDRLIAESRFTVLPSHAYETLGKTILESYAQSRAVIATDLGSRREFVKHGETGLLYPYGNVNQLAAAIQFLATNPECAQQMGQAGSEWLLLHHDSEAYYKRLLEMYQGLIESKSTKAAVFTITKETRPETSLVPVAPKLKIAFIGGRGVISKYSGIETYYEEVGKHLAEMGHSVTIYCRNYFTPKLAGHNGMRLVRLPTLRSKHLETVIHTLLSSLHAMTQRYDVVHYHALGPALFSLLPRLAGTETAVTVQGLDWQRKKWGRLASAVLRLGEKASVKLPNGTMVVSRTLQERYQEVHGAKVSFVPNGGILRERSMPSKILEWELTPQKYVLFMGRFSPEKGCHLLVEAFERLDTRLDTDVKLVMAGAASYCDDYSRELRRHASDRIRMLDWVSGDTLSELLTNAMIFVLPSDLEGLSLALLDAMGASLCVLTSDVPENREVVDGAGFTFKRGDSADLAHRLQFLIANPAVREAAGRAARQRIEETYQWPKIAADIEAVYYDMLRGEAELQPSRKPIAPALPPVRAESLSERQAG